jgi:hypothetical protein
MEPLAIFTTAITITTITTTQRHSALTFSKADVTN